MKNKAYIVANEEQGLRVLNEFEKRGYCWINDQGKPISSGVLIVRELKDYPLFIGERFETKTIYWQDLSKLVNEEIVYDGRKEEQMSEKYVVSQEFMNGLEEWKADIRHEWFDKKSDGKWLNSADISDLESITEDWWLDPKTSYKESNNRLIAIIRWVNGEDVFEVEKPKKWVVRSKVCVACVHVYLRHIMAFGILTTEGVNRDYAKKFDTKEEAESWANEHQEVIEVEDV